MKLLSTLLVAATFIVSGTAFAHSDDYLDTIATPHGGQMRMAGAFHYELVVESGAVTVYVTDHASQSVDTAKATGSVTLLVGAQRSTITLSPAGDNRLGGKGEFAMDASMRAVVNITLPGQQAQQARFTPLAPRQVKAMAAETMDDHSHH